MIYHHGNSEHRDDLWAVHSRNLRTKLNKIFAAHSKRLRKKIKMKVNRQEKNRNTKLYQFYFSEITFYKL
jgi:hypothetical protein